MWKLSRKKRRWIQCSYPCLILSYLILSRFWAQAPVVHWQDRESAAILNVTTGCHCFVLKSPNITHFTLKRFLTARERCWAQHVNLNGGALCPRSSHLHGSTHSLILYASKENVENIKVHYAASISCVNELTLANNLHWISPPYPEGRLMFPELTHRILDIFYLV